MERFDFLRVMLDEGVRSGCFPSAVCAVGQGDRVFARLSAGNCDLDTRFDMASLSKVMATAMIALTALERGELTLSDPLSVFFDAPPDKAGITVFQLMTHTGGFEPAFLLEDEITDPKDAARCILNHPLVAAPDCTPRYSCMGYILLGKILEKLLGAPLDELARARAFGPLGMAHTGYNPEGGNIAPTEVDPMTGIAWRGVVHDENARFLGGVSGNAGVFSNLDDCIRFAAMLATGGAGFLSPATLRLATANHTPGHDTHRGLGFQLGGTPGCFMGGLFPPHSFGHTGFTGTSLAVDGQTGLYVVLLTNRVYPTRENDLLLPFRRALHDRVYAAFSRMC